MKNLSVYVQSVLTVMTVVAASVACYFAWSVDIGTAWRWLIFTANAIPVTVSVMCALSAVRGLMDVTTASTTQKLAHQRSANE